MIYYVMAHKFHIWRSFEVHSILYRKRMCNCPEHWILFWFCIIIFTINNIILGACIRYSVAWEIFHFIISEVVSVIHRDRSKNFHFHFFFFWENRTVLKFWLTRYLYTIIKFDHNFSKCAKITRRQIDEKTMCFDVVHVAQY